MLVIRTSIVSGITRSIELPISEEEWNAYMDGTLVQIAFPHLDEDEREFILTGTIPEEWDELMSEDEDYDSDESIYDMFDDAAF